MMSVNKTWLLGTLISGVMAVGLLQSANAQSWQPAKSSLSDDNNTSGQASRRVDEDVAPVDWEERTLRRPLNWQQQNGQPAVQRPAQPMNQPPRRPMQEPRSGGVYHSARRTSYDQDTVVGEPMPVQPGPAIRSTRPGAAVPHRGPEVIPPGTQFEPLAQEGEVVDEGFAGMGGMESMGGEPCDDCGECGDCGPCGRCGDGCCDWPIFDGCCGPWLHGLSVFMGGDAFKGPLDRGTNGNFGMNEGLNLARPLGDPWGCGYQIGANFVQSDFSGAKALVLEDNTTVSAPYRKQYFATAAIFRRAECNGFQWGVAYDYLHDIYVSNANLQQIRSETSYLIDNTWELGYFGAYGVSSDRDRVIDGKLDPTDMFCLYVRQKFECGGNGRIFGGATGTGDGLFGAEVWVPLGKGFALQNEINYRIPKRGKNDAADPSVTPRESWGFVMQLVWYPGQKATCENSNPYRPMFNVADNSLFMVDRLAK
ncbi:MAG: hypothetical protein LLG00_04445 [Planctomycetaceae bacterium]|nr:hypothetical protein [Planctomycetaceae bacterium]